MRIGWHSAVAVSLVSSLVFGSEPENPKATRILIHEHLNESCELVRSGQLLQYRDYAAIVVDGTSENVYSLELSPGSFIEPASGYGKEIKSASKAGFVVKRTAVSIESDLPRVVAIAPGTTCPVLQDAVTLEAKQRGSRRESIQGKLYHPGFDDVTPPIWEASARKPENNPSMDANAAPSGKPKVQHGTVILAVAIGPDGAVKDTKVVRSLDASLDSKAMEEVRSWRFQPARRRGLPVAALVNVEVNFNLH